MKEVYSVLSKDLIKRKIEILNKALQEDFKILNPKIAV